MSDDQDSFYDLPFGKMSQTAKRSCPDDFDKAIDKMISTTDTKPLNSKPRCPTRIAPRRLAYPTESPGLVARDEGCGLVLRQRILPAMIWMTLVTRLS